MRSARLSHRLPIALALGLCTLALGACGDTLQDQPISHKTLESLLLAPYPVYWLGGSFQGMAITEASQDPSGAFAVQYGDCSAGGQNTCVPRLRVVSSPDNSFIAWARSRTVPSRSAASPAWRHREMRRSSCPPRVWWSASTPTAPTSLAPPLRRPCRSTKQALPPRRCPPHFQTRASPSSPYPVRCRLPCATALAPSRSGTVRGARRSSSA